jgi:hypothetical protein
MWHISWCTKECDSNLESEQCVLQINFDLKDLLVITMQNL